MSGRISSRRIAQAAAARRKKKDDSPKKKEEKYNYPRAGGDNEWSRPPLYRGGDRPPRYTKPPNQSVRTSQDSSGHPRQFFNPKAKLDLSQVRDLRPSRISDEDRELTSEPHWQWEKPWRKPDSIKADPNFKWNPSLGNHPLPRHPAYKDDMRPSQKAMATAMEMLIEKARMQRDYLSSRDKGTPGWGQ
jgi:hypothetical protein